MRPEYRRYAGILLDLFYDHFLAVKWSRYSHLPLEDFARRVYWILQTNQRDVMAPMQRSMNYMVSNELLQSYQEIAGIERALSGIEGRLKRPSRLSGAIAELEANYRDLEEDFVEFFPELTRYTQQLNLSRDRGPPDF